MTDRPLGVTIICIIQFFGAIILIASGIFVIIVGPLLFFDVLGTLIVVLGILAFFVTFGLWQLKSWALWLTVILNIISIVLNVFTGAFFGIIIPIIVVIYLLIDFQL